MTLDEIYQQLREFKSFCISCHTYQQVSCPKWPIQLMDAFTKSPNPTQNESQNKTFPDIKVRLYVNNIVYRLLCHAQRKAWTHRQMDEVHHGHSAVHVSSVASFGRVVIFIPFVLTAVGNLSASRRAGESGCSSRSPIWIEKPQFLL